MQNRGFEVNGDAVGTEGSATAEQITERKPLRGQTDKCAHIDELGFFKKKPGQPFNGVSD